MTQSKSQVFDKVERFITKEMEKRHVPGFSVAIVQGKEIVWAKGFGYSNLEREIPASPETVYRVASVSKPVIATGLLQWMERGRFHLDDPVNDLMEEVKIQTPFKEQPTVRNLLSHTSGLPVHVDPLYFHINETVSLEDLIRESAIAVYPPNERIIYSNTAFNIIGYLVGLFAGEPYPHYMERGLFKPLEMNSSSFEQTPKIRRLMAQPYSCKKPGGPLEAVKPWNMQGVEGVHRFLQKLWRLAVDKDTGELDKAVQDAKADEATLRLLDQTIKKVGDDIESFGFNTAISAMMILLNHLVKLTVVPRVAVEKLVLILAPFAPHIAEELWQKLGHSESLAYESWPEYDPELVKEKEIELAVQVNGKIKDKIVVAADASEEQIKQQALSAEKVAAAIGVKEPRKIIVIKSRLVNIVV